MQKYLRRWHVPINPRNWSKHRWDYLTHVLIGGVAAVSIILGSFFFSPAAFLLLGSLILIAALWHQTVGWARKNDEGSRDIGDVLTGFIILGLMSTGYLIYHLISSN